MTCREPGGCPFPDQCVECDCRSFREAAEVPDVAGGDIARGHALRGAHDQTGASRVPYVYLAGPMTGYPEYNFPAFRAVAAELRAAGHEVWSPAEQDEELDGFNPATDKAESFVHYMRRDLPAVMGAAAVWVLPGWEKSKGAQLEVHVARECGIPVCDLAGRELVAPSENVLEAANRLTGGDRLGSYGHPIEDFGRTAGMVSSMLGHKLSDPITAAEWGAVMACVKLSRLVATPGHRDSMIDLAGYARTIEMVYERLEEVIP